MNISVNSVNFNGKREVLYGLSMAAKETRNAEMFKVLMQGPRPMNRHTEARTSEALSKAYLVMSAYDDSFYSTIKNISEDECQNLKADLKPEILQYGAINPLESFKKVLAECLVKHNKPIDTTALNEFFTKIATRGTYKI